MLRVSKDPWSGEQFDRHIGLKRANAEALHAQAVGVSFPHDQMCRNCQSGEGPYNACVIVPKLRNTVAECANYHHGEQKHRCSFLKDMANQHTQGSEDSGLLSSTDAIPSCNILFIHSVDKGSKELGQRSES
jgi:hypothetical protein